MGSAGGERPIRLLHLSDIHFRGSKSWDARPVLHALTEFVAKTVEAEGPPDLVAIQRRRPRRHHLYRHG
jgi:hypothetical protein